MSARGVRHALAALLAAATAATAGGAAAAAGDPHAAGAYCPLPEPGQKPHCLEPAKQTYAEFFTALEAGTPAEADAARLEGDLAAGAASEQAYLALSSLAYGYWLLSERAEAEHADSAVVLRLERWNALLRQAYAASPSDARYRAALREAALDLHRRAPPVRVRCVAADGASTECDSTEAVLRGIDATAGEVGLRGALSRLLARILGSEAP
jgi:hypothetical protein